MRIIAHFDMDAFFALVEEKDKPYLRGLPVVIGADPKDGFGRGVVSTANYKARAYGIHSAQPISIAWRLSEEARKDGKPPALFLEPDIEKYVKVSEKVMAILRKYGSKIEQVGLDEAYIDMSFTGSFPKAKKLAEEIEKEIKENEKLTVSVGISSNKLLAKIASDIKKPDGLTIITPKKVDKFLSPLSIRKIPGIGPKTEKLFNEMGIKQVSKLRQLSKKELQDILGKRGVDLYYYARGRDESPLIEKYETKSIGKQETFLEDTKNTAIVLKTMEKICQEVFKEFRRSGFRTFRTLTIAVRFADFETKTRAKTLQKPASTLDAVYLNALRLLLPFFDRRENPGNKAFRLVGTRVEKLS